MNETDTAPPPDSPWTPSMVRKLKIAVAILSVLLVAGFILLLIGIYIQTQKLTEKSEDTSPKSVRPGIFGTTNIPVRAGAELTQMLVEQEQLILHFRLPKGGEIAIIDLATGREIQRFKLTPQE